MDSEQVDPIHLKVSVSVVGARAAGFLAVLGLLCHAVSAHTILWPDLLLQVHPIFSDHMVLQRESEIRVWGWSMPGTEVVAGLGEEWATARTDAGGRWEVILGARPAGGPHTLTVTTGMLILEFTDILIGDVWLTSGQSNMEWPLAWSLNATEEIAAADWPQIRLLKVPHQAAPCPRETLELGEWRVCTPESVAMFAAPAYFMARDLHRDLGVPIGVIDTSWGGATLEAWTQIDLIRGDPLFEDEIAARDAWAEQWDWLCDAEVFQDALATWHRQTGGDGGHIDPGRHPRTSDWAAREMSLSEWQPINLPGSWEQHGHPTADGVFWFRREVAIPPPWRGRDLRVNLGKIDDDDITYFNGVEVGRTGPFPNAWLQSRSYLIPGEITDTETATIAVRIFDGGGPGGFVGQPSAMSFHPAEDFASSIPLSGGWRFRPEMVLQGNPLVVGERPHQRAASLFNSMIHPLAGFPLRGIAWCQGEANVARHATHRDLLGRMIRDWRGGFNQPDLPFLLVQLASFDGGWPGWPELQWAQAEVARDLPNVGLVVTADLGAPDNLHYLDKSEVGRRLALAAREIAHGMPILGLSPSVISARWRGQEVILEFDHAVGGLLADDMAADRLQGFEVLATDNEWHDVPGRVVDDCVMLEIDSLTPHAVRYHWGDWPIGHVRNRSDLPLSIFALEVTADGPSR